MVARTSRYLVRMSTFSPPIRALAGAARDIAASMIVPAADTEDHAARRHDPAMCAFAEANLLSAAMFAGPVSNTKFTMVPGA